MKDKATQLKHKIKKHKKQTNKSKKQQIRQVKLYIERRPGTL